MSIYAIRLENIDSLSKTMEDFISRKPKGNALVFLNSLAECKFLQKKYRYEYRCEFISHLCSHPLRCVMLNKFNRKEIDFLFTVGTVLNAHIKADSAAILRRTNSEMIYEAMIDKSEIVYDYTDATQRFFIGE